MPRRNHKTRDEAPSQGKSPYFIDGNVFRNLEEFYDEVAHVLIPGESWGRNLDALADILTWPDEVDKPYTLVWLNSDVSRQRLHHGHMVQWLEDALEYCHPTGRQWMLDRYEQALNGEGPTLFDFLIDVISRRSKYVRLVLA